MNESKKKNELEAVLDRIDLSQPEPAEEPMRQYYFMKKARELVEKQQKDCRTIKKLYICSPNRPTSGSCRPKG